MNKYEQLIEHIINDEEGKARALFHEIVVEKSRDIYESLMDEEYTEEGIGGDQVGGLVDEITMDETDGIGEGEDDFDMSDMSSDDEEDMGEEDLESKVMNLEAELEALRAEFEQIMGDEDMSDEGEGMGDEESMDDEGDEDMSDEEDEEMFEAADEDDEDDEKEMKESRRSMSAVDIMREYVEKISAPSNTEFAPVGTGAGGDKASGNTNNPLAGKNDMGGTSQNIAKGGSNSVPDGTSAPKKGTVKDVKDANNWENKPGAKAGNAFSNKPKAKSGEESGINKSSIESGGN
jgi:hypothetical protein